MSTSLLYHGFGIRGYQHRRTDYEDGGVIFTIAQPRERRACPQCGSRDVHQRGTVDRTFRTVPIGSKPVRITLKVPRVRCEACDVVRQVAVPFAEPRKSYNQLPGSWVRSR